MRMIHLTFTARDGSGAALRAFLARAIPYYEANPGTRIRLLASNTTAGEFIEVVEYESPAAFAADEARMKTDPKMLALLAEWRGLIADLRVTTWEDVTRTIPQPG